MPPLHRQTLRASAVLIFLACLLLSAPCRGHAGAQDLLSITHFSTLLHRDQTVHVYLPPQAQPAAKLPVLYILPPQESTPEDWLRRTRLLRFAQQYRLILVLPSGPRDGWMIDSPLQQHHQYGKYILEELIPLVDRMFPSIARGDGRGLMGVGHAGISALHLAARSPMEFHSVSAVLPPRDTTQSLLPLLGPVTDQAAWEPFSPEGLATGHKGRVLLLVQPDADAPPALERRQKALHNALLEAGVPHIWRPNQSGHDWSAWGTLLPEHLSFHQAASMHSIPDVEKDFRHFYDRLYRMHIRNAKLALTPPNKPVVTLIGNAIAQDFPAELLPEFHLANRAVDSAKIDPEKAGLLKRLNVCVFDLEADVIVVQPGVGELQHLWLEGTPPLDQLIANVDRVLGHIRRQRPGVPLILVNAPPTRDRYEDLNPAIRAFNAALPELAARYGADVMDLHSALTDEEGELRLDYSYNGLKWRRPAYEAWARLIREAVGSAHARAPQIAQRPAESAPEPETGGW